MYVTSIGCSGSFARRSAAACVSLMNTSDSHLAARSLTASVASTSSVSISAVASGMHDPHGSGFLAVRLHEMPPSTTSGITGTPMVDMQGMTLGSPVALLAHAVAF